MRSIVRAVALTALVAGSLLRVASPADAATINVGPGQSIQAAINRANPGDTINVAAGTYYESLLIRKDGIKLIGAGDNPSGTVLLPPASYSGFCSDEGHGFPGICVIAKKFDDNFNVVTPVNGVRIEGFFVRNFPGDGIVSFGASHSTFVNDTAAGNRGYGITSFVAEGNVFNRLVSRNNAAPGFYIGDTLDSNFVLMNSFSIGNELGILIREANHGEIKNNLFQDNCAGILMFNHGNSPEADAKVSRWNIHDNEVLHNNRECEGHGEGDPGLKGGGIVLGGARNNNIHDNTVKGNQGVADNPFSGGIVLVDSTELAGGNTPANNVISNNTALNNKPFDIRYDGSGFGNTFPNNTCNTSKPAFICA